MRFFVFQIILYLLFVSISFAQTGMITNDTDYTLSFDGINDFITVPYRSDFDVTAMTIECWVKFRDIETSGENDNYGFFEQVIATKGIDNQAGTFHLFERRDDNKYYIGFEAGQYYSGNIVISSQLNLVSGQWYHVAGTYDGNTLKVFLNGVNVGSKEIGSYNFNNTSNLYFGYNPYEESDLWKYYLNGYLKDIRLWSTARDSEQIQETMYEHVTDSPGLISSWCLDTQGEQIVPDVAGEHHGYLGSSNTQDENDPVWTETEGMENNIILVHPSGGESIYYGKTTQIKWSSWGIDSVTIEYSTDNGTTWHTIIESIDASQNTLSWSAPAIESSNCLIRISSVENSDVSDTSHTPFSITEPSLWTVYTENYVINENEVYVVTNDYNGGIWVGTRTQGGISHYDGKSWTNYNTSNSGLTGNDVYALAVGHDGILWVGTTWNGLCRFDGSNWTSYTAENSPLPTNTIRDMAVDHNNVLWLTFWRSGLVSFDGTNWKSYSNEPNGEILTADIDNSIWVGYRYGKGGTSHFQGDSEKRYFQEDGLAGAYVRGIAADKNGIKWFATSGGVSTYDGNTWHTYDHLRGKTVLSVAIDQDDVKWFGYDRGISSFDGVEWKDYAPDNNDSVHNHFFRIAVDENNVKWFAAIEGGVLSFDYHLGPDLIITSPDGGEFFETGNTSNITWRTRNVEYVNLEYSTDSGSTWHTIAQNVDASTGLYVWALPDHESKNYVVRVTDSTNPEIKDSSNEPFSISPPFVSIVSPNGDEKWAIETTHDIKWNSVGAAKVNIEYSLDNGVSWHVIKENCEASDGSSSWILPEKESEHCLVRINADEKQLTDSSDGTFTIAQPYITVTYPNGGEILTAEESPVITWESDGIEEVTIEYSVDSGATWNPIAENIDGASHSFVWDPYPVTSMLCYVKISDSSENNLYDTSDSQFVYLLEVSVDDTSPEEFTVFQNYPNPFNPSTTISFSLPEEGYVKLAVYNLSGQKITTLVDSDMPAGTHQVVFDGSNLSSGMYFYRVEAGIERLTGKMLLMK